MSTIQQSLELGNSVHSTSTSVNAVSSDSHQRQNSRNTSQGASRDYDNHRRHDDLQGQHRPRHSTNRGGQGPSMNTRQRATPRYANLDTVSHAFAQDGGNRRITKLNAQRGANFVINAINAITLQIYAGPLLQN